jgi:hypothetical protein
LQESNNEDQEVLEQAPDDDLKLELNARDFMEDDEVEESPELGR